MTQAPTLLAYTPIVAGRESDFEDWLFNTIFPAMKKQVPDQVDRVQVFRSLDGPVDGVVMYTIAFSGGALGDWNIKPFLAKEIGEEAASRELARMEAMCPDGQTAYALTRVPDEVAAAAWEEDSTSADSSWPAASTSH